MANSPKRLRVKLALTVLASLSAMAAIVLAVVALTEPSWLNENGENSAWLRTAWLISMGLWSMSFLASTMVDTEKVVGLSREEEDRLTPPN